MRFAGHIKHGFLKFRVHKPLRFHSTRTRPKHIRTQQTNRFVEPIFAPHLIPRGSS
jgi:hypothetical protein